MVSIYVRARTLRKVKVAIYLYDAVFNKALVCVVFKYRSVNSKELGE